MEFLQKLFKFPTIIVTLFVGFIFLVIAIVIISSFTCKEHTEYYLESTDRILANGGILHCRKSDWWWSYFLTGTDSGDDTSFTYTPPGSDKSEYIDSDCIEEGYFVDGLVILPKCLTKWIVRSKDGKWQKFDTFSLLRKDIEKTNYFYKIFSKLNTSSSIRLNMNVEESSLNYSTFFFNYMLKVSLTEDGTDLNLNIIKRDLKKELNSRKLKTEKSLNINIPIDWEVGQNTTYKMRSELVRFVVTDLLYTPNDQSHIIRLINDYDNNPVFFNDFSKFANRECARVFRRTQCCKKDKLTNNEVMKLKMDNIVVQSGQLIHGTTQIKEITESVQSVEGLLKINNRHFYFCAFSEELDSQIIENFLEQFLMDNSMLINITRKANKQ